MNVHQTLLAALQPVLANAWPVELPPRPTFPAIVFDVDTTPEAAWCLGGGYDQHTVNIIAMGDLDQVLALIPTGDGGGVRAALAALGAVYMFEEDSGDADYEADAAVFARFLSVRLRTPRHQA